MGHGAHKCLGRDKWTFACRCLVRTSPIRGNTRQFAVQDRGHCVDGRGAHVELTVDHVTGVTKCVQAAREPQAQSSC